MAALRPRHFAHSFSQVSWSRWRLPRARAECHLDDPERAAPALDFCECLYPKTGVVARALARLRVQVRGEADTFPGLRPGTRMELYRRLHRGRDFLFSCYDRH